ncbi:MAG: glycosyltransferase family 9 protein [Candidatus Omnitrophica bacterium]|nr:glycosyltransferase family 9 protein [Candidatus Omnitrophota bacterium]
MLQRQKLKREKILLIRTDRIGDLILTTPAIKAVRCAYPGAHIAMIVRPYTQDIVRENPFLDEIIVYDKLSKHRSWLAGFRFAMELKRKGFGMALIFNPTNRMHITAFLAGIPRRIGYDNKLRFLLTNAVKNTKHLGLKHERDYAIDMLKAVGIYSDEKELCFNVNGFSGERAREALLAEGINDKDRFVVIHPGASCPSKIWPAERFAGLADALVRSYGVKVVIVSGAAAADSACALSVQRFMQYTPVLFAGSLDIGCLAALIKKSVLFISNDSGPVHIAVAVGTPVVDIFGRSQSGLGPLRWGPLGPRDIVMHKDAGCGQACLAHDCKRNFACLLSVSVDDVFKAIASAGLL